MRDHFSLETNIVSRMGEFFEVEGVHFISSLCVGKVSFVVSMQLLDNILYSMNPADKTQAPLERDLALIRSLLIITRLNVENIIVLGTQHPGLQRIILEDTRFTDFNNYLKKNIHFKKVDLEKEMNLEDQS